MPEITIEVNQRGLYMKHLSCIARNFKSMKIINSIIFIITLSFIIIGCKRTDEAEFILPKGYLPAYPGSYWDYTNGERVLTSPNFVLHSFPDSLEAIKSSEDFYVPMYNNQYLYEYCITQNSKTYPIKKLLDEKAGDAWMVTKINNEPIMRQVSATLDKLVVPFPPYDNPIDCVFTNIIVVVEFIDSLGVNRWNTKEFYAKDVGLIRVDVNNPFDEHGSIIQKQIKGYRIKN